VKSEDENCPDLGHRVDTAMAAPAGDDCFEDDPSAQFANPDDEAAYYRSMVSQAGDGEEEGSEFEEDEDDPLGI